VFNGCHSRRERIKKPIEYFVVLDVSEFVNSGSDIFREFFGEYPQERRDAFDCMLYYDVDIKEFYFGFGIDSGIKYNVKLDVYNSFRVDNFLLRCKLVGIEDLTFAAFFKVVDVYKFENRKGG
jgi:hypothetical protein